MHARGIAPQCDIGGQLVEFTAHREGRASIRHQRESIRTQHDRRGQFMRFLEKRLEHRGTGTRDSGMASGIGRMRGTPFGIGHGQQIRTCRACDFFQHRRREQIAMQWVLGNMGEMIMDASAKGFWAQP